MDLFKTYIAKLLFLPYEIGMTLFPSIILIFGFRGGIVIAKNILGSIVVLPCAIFGVFIINKRSFMDPEYKKMNLTQLQEGENRPSYMDNYL